MRKICFILCVTLLWNLLFHFQWTFAQENQFLETILEQIEDEEGENFELVEYLWELMENPLDLNKATLEDFKRIPFVPNHVAQEIIDFRSLHNGFNHITELLSIQGMTEELYEALIPFVTVKPISKKGHVIYRFRLRKEFPKRRGFYEHVFSKPFYWQHRLLFNSNSSFSGGFLVEKDNGEKDYFDYQTYHFKYQNLNHNFSLLIGDYQMRIGCGLMLWSAYGLPLTASVMPFSNGFNIPEFENRSSNEFSFLRGVTISKILSTKTQFYLFYSTRHLDVTLSKDSSRIRNIYSSGLHRTSNERQKKGLWKSILSGALLSFRSGPLHLQLNAIVSNFDKPYKEFSKKQHHIGIAGSWNTKSIRITSEVSFFQSKFPAFQNFLYLFGKKMKYEIVTYYYHPQYFALYGRAFGTLSDIPINKTGIALLINYNLHRKTNISGYVHLYRDLYNSQIEPFLYKDYHVEIRKRFSGQTIRLQFHQRYRKNDLENVAVLEKSIRSLRLVYYSKLSSKIKFQNSLDIRWAYPLQGVDKFYGTGIYHQIEIQFKKNCQILSRWTNFDIPDYNLRIFEYEPDLPGTFRTSLLNHRGQKWLMLLRWKIKEILQLDIKYLYRYYPDLISIGSGLNSFDTNHVQEIGISLIWKY